MTRSLVVAVLALCIGTWLAMPPGFMPALADGVPAIVICPGSDGAVRAIEIGDTMPGMPMASQEHRRGSASPFQQTCPYAMAASLVAPGSGGAALQLPALLVAEPLRLSPSLPDFRRHATRDRPPAQGPPLPA